MGNPFEAMYPLPAAAKQPELLKEKDDKKDQESEGFVDDLLDKARALYKSAVDSKIYAQAFEKIKSVDAQDIADFLTKERESALIDGGGKVAYDFATSITGAKAISDWLMYLLDKAGMKTSVQGDVTKYFKENDMERALLGITSSVVELKQAKGNKIKEDRSSEEEVMYLQSKQNCTAAFKNFKAKIEAMNVPEEKKKELRHELKKIMAEHVRSEESLEKGQSQEFDSVMRKYTGAKVSAFKLGKDALNSALTMSGLFVYRGVSYVGFSALERGKKEWDNYSREAYKTKQEAGKIDGKKDDWKSTYSELSLDKTGAVLKDTVWGSAKETYNELIYGRKDGQLKGEEKLRKQEIKKQEKAETEKTLQELEKNGAGIFGQSWYLVKRELEIMKKNAPENFVKNITRLRTLGTAGAFLGIAGTGIAAYANEGNITSTLSKAYDNLIAGAGERGRLETVTDNMFGAVDRFGKLFDVEEWEKRFKLVKKAVGTIGAEVTNEFRKGFVSELGAEPIPDSLNIQKQSYMDYGNKLFMDHRKIHNEYYETYNKTKTDINELENKLKTEIISNKSGSNVSQISEDLQKERTALVELTAKINKNTDDYNVKMRELENLKATGKPLTETENIPENLKVQNQKFMEATRIYDEDFEKYNKTKTNIEALQGKLKTEIINNKPGSNVSKISENLQKERDALNALAAKMERDKINYNEEMAELKTGSVIEPSIKTGGTDEEIIDKAIKKTGVNITDEKIKKILVNVIGEYEEANKKPEDVENFIKIVGKISGNKSAENLLDEEVLKKIYERPFSNTEVDKLKYIFDSKHITGKGGGQEKLREAILENIKKTGDIDNSLATVYKGEGVIHSIRRQLEANPELYGYDGEDNFQAKHEWSAKMAQEIAENEGFVVREGKTIISYGVKEANNNAFKLDENKESPIEVNEINKGKDNFNEVLKIKNGMIVDENGEATERSAVEELVNKKILYKMEGKAIVEADEGAGEDDEETSPTISETEEAVIMPGSDKFNKLQAEMEATPLALGLDERRSLVNQMLENTDAELTAVNQHLKQGNLSSEAQSYWQRHIKRLLVEKERLTHSLGLKDNELPQTIKDLLPPEIISREGFNHITSSDQLSNTADWQQDAVNDLYIKHTGHSIKEFNELPERLKAGKLNQLNQDINKIVKSGVVSVEADRSLPRKALLWRNLEEMKHLQEIQKKFGGELNLPEAKIDYQQFIKSNSLEEVIGREISPAEGPTIYQAIKKGVNLDTLGKHYDQAVKFGGENPDVAIKYLRFMQNPSLSDAKEFLTLGGLADKKDFMDFKMSDGKMEFTVKPHDIISNINAKIIVENGNIRVTSDGGNFLTRALGRKLNWGEGKRIPFSMEKLGEALEHIEKVYKSW